MVSRMDKYQIDPVKPTPSRSQKNAYLYEELYANKVVTEFTGIETNNAIELSESPVSSFSNRRESFQKNKRLFSSNIEKTNDFFQKPILDKIDVQKDVSEKNYNINDVLDAARKNRTFDDEEEKKRHFKTVEYSILSDLSKEKIKEYQEQKQKLSKDEEENLEELIHTITSNSLKKKIEDELLSDLLPTEESETIISKELLDNIDSKSLSDLEKKDMDNNISDTVEQQMDNSFYTKSMDLSEEDFDFSDENEFILENSKMSMSRKIIIFLFIVFIIGIIIYILYRFL